MLLIILTVIHNNISMKQELNSEVSGEGIPIRF